MMIFRKITFICLFLIVACGENSSTLKTDSTSTTTTTSTSIWDVTFTNNVAKLSSPAYDYNQGFGYGVALGDFNGDSVIDLAVGASTSDIATNATAATDTGAAYVYYSLKDSATKTVADLYLTAGTNYSSSYGYDVEAGDINGDGFDDLVVGAPNDDLANSNNSGDGSVYIYYGSSTGLSTTADQIINQPNNTSNSGFGTGVHIADLDGDNYPELLVGSSYDDTTAGNVGGVWIFTGTVSGFYSKSSGTLIRLSTTLDTSQDYCGMGVWTHDYNSDGKLDIYMGCPLNDNAGTDWGSVSIFHGTGVQGTWVANATTPEATLNNPAGANTDYFGTSMVTFDYDNDGLDDLLVGVPYADDQFAGSGAIYVYSDIRGSTVLDNQIGPPANYKNVDVSYFAWDMDVADVNGDGQQDLVVGAPLEGSFGYRNGRASVFYGSSTGPMGLTSEDVAVSYHYHTSPTPNRNTSEDYFGSALCSIDFNADGIKDVVVGSYNDDSKYADDGAAYVYYTRTDGKIRNEPSVRLTSPDAWNTAKEYGTACVAVDMNRDGYEDLLIGAWQDDASTANGGAVYVYYGSATGVSTTSGQRILGPDTTSYYFGHSLAVGDIDNDGYPDLIVGASYADPAAANSGALYVFQSNSTTGIIDTSSSTVRNHAGGANDYLGYSVLTFDVDGDGDQDLLGGAPYDDNAASNSGVVHIWLNGTNGATAGANTLLDNTVDNTLTQPLAQANVGFGWALAKGKYTNTSYDDLIIGAALNDLGGADAGAVYVYEGTSTGYNASPNTIFGLSDAAVDAGEWLGSAMLVHDFDNDGTNELLIGAATDDEPGVNSGTVYIKKK
jgi:hypothetical protein